MPDLVTWFRTLVALQATIVVAGKVGMENQVAEAGRTDLEQQRYIQFPSRPLRDVTQGAPPHRLADLPSEQPVKRGTTG